MTQLRLWFDWRNQRQLEPLADVRRPHVELYACDLEGKGLAYLAGATGAR